MKLQPNRRSQLSQNPGLGTVEWPVRALPPRNHNEGTQVARMREVAPPTHRRRCLACLRGSKPQEPAVESPEGPQDQHHHGGAGGNLLFGAGARPSRRRRCTPGADATAVLSPTPPYSRPGRYAGNQPTMFAPAPAAEDPASISGQGYGFRSMEAMQQRPAAKEDDDDEDHGESSPSRIGKAPRAS
jgi:hypothetical protein